jgi:hypothetical protein
MPVNMFANVGVEPEDAGLQALEKLLGAPWALHRGQ